MTINILEKAMEIPEDLIKKREKYMGFSTVEDNVNSLIRAGEAFCSCFQEGELSKEDMEKELLCYFEEMLETYIV